MLQVRRRGHGLPLVGAVVGVHRVDPHVVDLDAQPFGRELRHRGQCALADVDAADADRGGAVLVQPDERAGARDWAAWPAPSTWRPAPCPAPLWRGSAGAIAAAALPPDRLRGLADALAQPGRVHLHPGQRFVAVLQAVASAAPATGSSPSLLRHLVDVLLDAPVDLGHAEAAHRAADRVVGVDAHSCRRGCWARSTGRCRCSRPPRVMFTPYSVLAPPSQ